MALIAITTQMDDSPGTVKTDLDGAGTQLVDTSNTFYNQGSDIVVVSNASGGNRVVTFKGQADPYGRGGAAVGDVVLTIPAGKIGMSGFLNPAMFNAGGLCTFTVDAIATTKVAIFRLRKVR